MIDAVPTDLLRLLAVPLVGWAAYRDVRTRRVPNVVWAPLLALGVGLLAWDAVRLLGDPTWPLFAVRVVLSVGLLVPLAVGFWWIRAFGGADAKALMVFAVLFPVYPHYVVFPGALPLIDAPTLAVSLPLFEPVAGLFALSILANTVLAALGYPVALAARNLLAGRWSWLMVVGRPVPIEALPETHGRLLETPAGVTRSGCDLDALRMYLRWRETDLATLRADPDRARRPASLPARPADPGDGAIRTDGGAPLDPWGARTFVADAERTYGTSAADLRAALDLLVDPDREQVWVSPGIPFLVPMVAGLLLAVLAGDIVVWTMTATGLV